MFSHTRTENLFHTDLLPAEHTLEGKPFTLSAKTTIVYPDNNPDIERIAGFLAGYIEDATGYKPETTTERGENSIVLMSQLNTDNNEAYTINVSEANIIVNGATPAGTFYGVQTLRKAIPARAEGMEVKFANVEINDQPRFGYRGMHLDVSRHFFTADSVKRYIDLLASVPAAPHFIINEIYRDPEGIVELFLSVESEHGNIAYAVHLLEEHAREHGLKDFDAQHFCLALYSQCVFPFVLSPVIKTALFSADPDRYAEFLVRLKKNITRTAVSRLYPEG